VHAGHQALCQTGHTQFFSHRMLCAQPVQVSNAPAAARRGLGSLQLLHDTALPQRPHVTATPFCCKLFISSRCSCGCTQRGAPSKTPKAAVQLCHTL
jgi:hypothetical protein